MGSKTTFQVINQFWTEMMMNAGEGPQDAKWWYQDATLVLTSPYSQVRRPQDSGTVVNADEASLLGLLCHGTQHR